MEQETRLHYWVAAGSACTNHRLDPGLSPLSRIGSDRLVGIEIKDQTLTIWDHSRSYLKFLKNTLLDILFSKILYKLKV